MCGNTAATCHTSKRRDVPEYAPASVCVCIQCILNDQLTRIVCVCLVCVCVCSQVILIWSTIVVVAFGPRARVVIRTSSVVVSSTPKLRVRVCVRHFTLLSCTPNTELLWPFTRARAPNRRYHRTFYTHRRVSRARTRAHTHSVYSVEQRLAVMAY